MISVIVVGSSYGKTEADSLLKIDIYWLNKHDYLCGFKNGSIVWTSGSGSKNSVGISCQTIGESPRLRLHYTQTDIASGEKDDLDYSVLLVSTACNFGGKRWWFLCPLTRNGRACGNRIGVLYKNGSLFGCRHCHDLTYLSKSIDRRGSYFGSYRIIDADAKIGKIENSIKRRYYAGKPTKKQAQLDKLYASFSREYNNSDFRGLR